MNYTAAERQRVTSELEGLGACAEKWWLPHLVRAPLCAPHLPLHRSVQVADLHQVDWSALAPPIPECEEGADDPYEYIPCDCRHCLVMGTPRNVLRLVHALIHTRNFYTRLCRLPVLTALVEFSRREHASPPPTPEWSTPEWSTPEWSTPEWSTPEWPQAQQHLSEQRADDELRCDWQLQAGDDTFLDQTVVDRWMYTGDRENEDAGAANANANANACPECPECPDELHELFLEYSNNGGWFLPFPALLEEWRQLHPRGYRRWRHLLLRSFDILIVRTLASPSDAYAGKLCTCMLEEIALALTCYYLDSFIRDDPEHEQMLRDLMSDHDAVAQLHDRIPACRHDGIMGDQTLKQMLMGKEGTLTFLWPHWPTPAYFPPFRAGDTFSPTPAPREVRFPLDFVVPYRDKRMRLAHVPLLTHAPRRHLAAYRIHRFWRDVCSSTQYAYARRCIEYAMAEEGTVVMGRCQRRDGSPTPSG